MMNEELNNDRAADFEQRLKRVAPRKIPSAWRAGILTTARARSSRREEAQTSAPAARPSFLSTLIHQLSTSLHPHRAAWGSLAAVWLVILALNLTDRDQSARAQTASITPPSPQALAAWRQQRRELAGLTDPTPARPIVTPTKQTLPQPRSNRRDECLAA